MKVNEVIMEAPVGTGKFSRWLSKTFGTASGNEVAKDAVDQWAKQATMIERGGVDLTPQNYEQYLNHWLGKWLKLNGPYPGKLGSTITGTSVNDYIGRAVAQRLSNTLPGAVPLGTSAADAVKNAPPATAQGVKIINPEPPIIQFRGKDYVLDDLGDWIALESGKVIPQSFKQFLDQQLEIAQGLEPGSIKRTKN